jgi:hypothetical protein
MTTLLQKTFGAPAAGDFDREYLVGNSLQRQQLLTPPHGTTKE